MDKLKLLKMAENEDCEAYDYADLRPLEQKQSYEDFYNDIKQPKKYIKEDW